MTVTHPVTRSVVFLLVSVSFLSVVSDSSYESGMSTQRGRIANTVICLSAVHCLVTYKGTMYTLREPSKYT